jgi:hypothetical protein
MKYMNRNMQSVDREDLEYVNGIYKYNRESPEDQFLARRKKIIDVLIEKYGLRGICYRV